MSERNSSPCGALSDSGSKNSTKRKFGTHLAGNTTNSIFEWFASSSSAESNGENGLKRRRKQNSEEKPNLLNDEGATVSTGPDPCLPSTSDKPVKLETDPPPFLRSRRRLFNPTVYDRTNVKSPMYDGQTLRINSNKKAVDHCMSLTNIYSSSLAPMSVNISKHPYACPDRITTRSTSRKLANETNSLDKHETPIGYKLPFAGTNHNKNDRKQAHKMYAKDCDDPAPIAVNLPDIKFPSMKSIPNFDDSIKDILKSSSSSSEKNKFKFLKPITKPSINFNDKSKPNDITHPSLCIVNRTMVPKPSNELKSGSVMDVLNKFNNGLAKVDEVKIEKTWECYVCMIRNDYDVTECIACETARPVVPNTIKPYGTRGNNKLLKSICSSDTK